MLQLRPNGSGDLVRFRPRFRLDPPKAPFLARMPVSISLGQDISAEWLVAEPETSGGSGKRIFEDLVARASRDVRQHPGSARSRVNLATALLNAGRTDEAAEHLDRAMQLSPADRFVKLTRARLKIAQRRLNEAQEIYEGLSLADTSKADPFPLMGLAYIAIQRKDFTTAVDLLKRLAKYQSTSTMARYHLATIFMDQGRYREAIANLRQAVHDDVRLSALHEAMGVAYASLRNWKRASRSFRMALNLAPGTAETIRALAQILVQQGTNDSAVLLLSDLVSKYPADVRAREILGYSYIELHQYAKAKAHLVSAIDSLKREEQESSSSGVSISNNIGVCDFYLGDLEAAKRSYSYAIELAAHAFPTPYNNLAGIYLQQGETQRAQELIDICIRQFPDDPDTRVMLAVCLLEKNRNDDAVKQLTGMVDEGKGTARCYGLLGAVLADRKRDLKAALHILQDGIERFPADPGLVNNLAYVYLMNGDAASARKILESLPIEKVGASDRIPLTATWGLVYLWEGDLEKGRSEYRRAEELAVQVGNRRMGRLAKQKMHLELARAYLRRGDRQHATLEISSGLSIGDRTPYREDLETLDASLMLRYNS